MITAVSPLAQRSPYFPAAEKEQDDRMGIIRQQSLAPSFDEFIPKSPHLALIAIIHMPPSDRKLAILNWIKSFTWERLLETICSFPILPKNRENLIGPLFTYFLSQGYDLKAWLEADEDRLVLIHRASFGSKFLGVELFIEKACDPVEYLKSCRKPKETYFARMMDEEEPLERTVEEDDSYTQALSLFYLAKQYRTKRSLEYFKVVAQIRDVHLRAYVEREFPFSVTDGTCHQANNEDRFIRNGFCPLNPPSSRRIIRRTTNSLQ